MHIGFWWVGQNETEIVKPKRIWEDNVMVDPRKIGWCGMNWIDLAHDSDLQRVLVHTVINLLVP
jgi:hypothetical protein